MGIVVRTVLLALDNVVIKLSDKTMFKFPRLRLLKLQYILGSCSLPQDTPYTWGYSRLTKHNGYTHCIITSTRASTYSTQARCHMELSIKDSTFTAYSSLTKVPKTPASVALFQTPLKGKNVSSHKSLIWANLSLTLTAQPTSTG
jgi:phosphatidate phosphatase PAH1